MRHSYIQIIEYSITGLVTFILDLALIWLMTEIWGVSYIWSLTAGYIVAITLNYFINRDWAFKGTHMQITKGYINSVWVAIVSYIAVLALMIFFVEWLHFNYIVGRLFTGVIAGFLGYVLEAVFAFRMPIIYRSAGNLEAMRGL